LAREDVCPQIELPSSWEEYLSTHLDKKQRHELRRKMRRAEDEVKVNWRWVDAGGFNDGMEAFFRLHKASHPDKEAFMDERMQRFFREVARAALEKDWLRLGVLEYNGESVASYLCFDYGSDRLVYNSGFDLRLYGTLSPGIVLLGYLVRDAIGTGRKRFDFLQGNERYKYDMGARDTEVMRLVVQR
jgi:CelD/BcsL family acetyltransferase involved in cellulose biosynthesis